MMISFELVALGLLLLAGGATADPRLGHCKMCAWVLETIRSGFPYSLSTICQNNLALGENADDFEICQEVVAVLSSYGPSVALWQSEGCFRTEEYGAVEKMTPCPAHVICSQMETLKSFVVTSELISDNTKYDHNKLRARQIRPRSKYSSKSDIDKLVLSSTALNTFCPPPKQQ